MNNPNLKDLLSNTFIPFSDSPIPFNQDQLAERLDSQNIINLQIEIEGLEDGLNRLKALSKELF